MRLKKSRAAGTEELTRLAAQGYHLRQQSVDERTAGKADVAALQTRFDAWWKLVSSALTGIFPTDLEVHQLANAPPSSPVRMVEPEGRWVNLNALWVDVLRELDRIIERRFERYTDLPLKARLYIEDVDSFMKVRDVNPAMVGDVLRKDGYLDLEENKIQVALEQILNVSLHKLDWGGEINDLYTTNMVVNGSRVATAFLLKGHGLKCAMMEIAHCGKNGDQLVRLFDSPAELFVVQFVGEVSEAVIRDVAGKVDQRRAQGKGGWYCIMNGQDTARVLRAYGRL